MSNFFDRNNPIWQRHNIVVTIAILALLATLPLSILMVATARRSADLRSRASERDRLGQKISSVLSRYKTTAKISSSGVGACRRISSSLCQNKPLSSNWDPDRQKFVFYPNNNCDGSPVVLWDYCESATAVCQAFGGYCKTGGSCDPGDADFGRFDFSCSDGAGCCLQDSCLPIANCREDFDLPFALDKDFYAIYLGGVAPIDFNFYGNDTCTEKIFGLDDDELTIREKIVEYCYSSQQPTPTVFIPSNTPSPTRTQPPPSPVPTNIRTPSPSRTPPPRPTPTTGAFPSCQRLLDLATNGFRTGCGDENYDPRADINKDGTINTLDISLITSNISNQNWCAEKLQDDTSPCDTTPTHIPTPITTPAPKPPPCDAFGDVDADGFVSQTDADLVMQAGTGLIELTPEQQFRADVTADGKVDILDAVTILRYLNGLSESFPVCYLSLMCRADFNRNGDIDIEDLQVVVDEARQDCAIPFPTPTPIPCETDKDCSPDFGRCQQGFCTRNSGPSQCRADFNSNGDIDIEDLQVLIEEAQQECAVAN